MCFQGKEQSPKDSLWCWRSMLLWSFRTDPCQWGGRAGPWHTIQKLISLCEMGGNFNSFNAFQKMKQNSIRLLKYYLEQD